MESGFGPQCQIDFNAGLSAGMSNCTFVLVPAARELVLTEPKICSVGMRDCPCAQFCMSVRETNVYPAFMATCTVPSGSAVLVA